MKIDKSRLLKKAKKLLDITKDKSNPDGWEINFEVIEEYKVGTRPIRCWYLLNRDKVRICRTHKTFWKSI